MSKTRSGIIRIRCLPILDSRPYDEVAKCYLSALRPSDIRVIGWDKPEKCDSLMWRVTVYLDEDGLIYKVMQQVLVELPAGVNNGYELEQKYGSGEA